MKLRESDIKIYNQLIVYALLAVAEIEQFSVPTKFLIKLFLCVFIYTMHSMLGLNKESPN